MKKIMILIFSIQSLCLLANQPNDTVVSKQQIMEIENKIGELESKVKNSVINTNEANSMIKVAEGYSESAKNLLTTFIAIISAIIAITAFVVVNIYKGIITKKIAEVTEENKETIIKLVGKQKIELEILSKSKILIINKTDTNVNEYLEKVLKKFANKIETENIPVLSIHEFKNEFKNYDLVLFDNTNTTDESKNWKDDDLSVRLVEIAKEVCDSNVAFFFFGKVDGGFAKKQELTAYLHLINFSNSPSTAYSNIINLLNFRKLLLEK